MILLLLLLLSNCSTVKIIMTNQRLKRYRNCDLFHLIDVIIINGRVACVFHILLAELPPPTAEKNARKLYFTIIKVNAVYHHIFSLEYFRIYIHHTEVFQHKRH